MDEKEHPAMSGTAFNLRQHASLSGHMGNVVADILTGSNFRARRLLRGMQRDRDRFHDLISVAFHTFYEECAAGDPSVLRVQRNRYHTLDDLILDILRRRETGWEIIEQNARSSGLDEIDLPEVELLQPPRNQNETPWPTPFESMRRLAALEGNRMVPLDIYWWAMFHLWHRDRGNKKRIPKRWMKLGGVIVFPGTLLSLGYSQYYPVVRVAGEHLHWDVVDAVAPYTPFVLYVPAMRL